MLVNAPCCKCNGAATSGAAAVLLMTQRLDAATSGAAAVLLMTQRLDGKDAEQRLSRRARPGAMVAPHMKFGRCQALQHERPHSESVQHLHSMSLIGSTNPNSILMHHAVVEPLLQEESWLPTSVMSSSTSRWRRRGMQPAAAASQP